MSNLGKSVLRRSKRKIAAVLGRRRAQQLHAQFDRMRTAWRLVGDKPVDRKPVMLFYDSEGLSSSGTSKTLQILARHLDKDRYSVFYMYPIRQDTRRLGNTSPDGWRDYVLSGHVNLIPFDFHSIEPDYPLVVHGMSPNVFDVIRALRVSVIVTAGAGRSQFPVNLIRRTPILFWNIFGGEHDQPNIVKHICVSKTVASLAARSIRGDKIEVMYNPTEGPNPSSSLDGLALRRRLGIPDEDIVFGRIGRPDDSIFDPIGIRAFQCVVTEKPWVHYLIMSPPPILERLVHDEGLPNVYLLSPSSREEDVWAFHNAIDVLAHFRRDGESCGLSIGEAMLCGKPIISHRSLQWNAHLEYLDPTCSFVADVDNVDQYRHALEMFGEDRDRSLIKRMGERAREKATPLFKIEHSLCRFTAWIDEILS